MTRSHVLVLVTLVCLVPTARPLGAAPISDAALDRLVTLSGADGQLAGLSSAVWSAVTERRRTQPTPDAALVAALEPRVRAAYAPAALRERLKAEVRSALTDEDAVELLRRYDSAEARAVAVAEAAANRPDAGATMSRLAPALLADARLVEAATTLDTLLGTAEQSVKGSMRTAVAAFSALSALTHPKDPGRVEAFRRGLAAVEVPMTETARKGVIVILVVAYRDLPPAVLEGHVAFHRRPAARAFTAAIHRGMEAAMTEATTALWADLAARPPLPPPTKR